VNVSDIGLLDDIEFHAPNDPIAGSSRVLTTKGQYSSFGNDKNGSSQTIPSQLKSRHESQPNIRPYFAEIDQFVAGYRAGKQTKLEVTLAVL